MRLGGKTVLITGASSGIGRALSLAVAQEGGKVVAHGRDKSRLEKLMGDLPGEGHISVERDLSAETTGVEAWVDQIVAQAGQLSGFVHSAGVSRIEPLKVMDNVALDEMWRLHVASALMICKGVRKPKNHVKGASIVFLSSVAALKGRPGQIAYAATKGALVSMTRAMSLELIRDGVRVNSVAPAVIETEMYQRLIDEGLPAEMSQSIVDQHPMGLGLPKDVNALICFLLSDESRYINGVTVPLDGGYTAG